MNLKTPYEMALDCALRFRALRKARKITIKLLCKKSGVPYSTIRRFESTGEISFVSFVKLASAMNEDDQINTLFVQKTPLSIEEAIRANRG